MREFQGKGAVVTGAASGIGKGIAGALADAGMNLLLIDIEQQPLDRVRAALASTGVRIETLVADVSDRDALRDAAAQAPELIGRVHVLCNNAGGGYAGVMLDQVPDGDWDWVGGVNLMGVINGLQAFLPRITAHGEGGHIPNPAAPAIRRSRPCWGHGVYSTTKFAVVGLSEALADDLAAHDIGVSVLCPGAVDTDIYQGGRNRPDRFGGPFARPADHPLVGALKDGMSPAEIGRWVVRAIRDNQLFIVPHPETRAVVEGRHARLMEAYDWAARVAGEI